MLSFEICDIVNANTCLELFTLSYLSSFTCRLVTTILAFHHYLLLLLLLSWPVFGLTCPSGCSCSSAKAKVTCVHFNIQLPLKLPPQTRYLRLRSTPPLVRLPQAAFGDASSLRTIFLSNNEIEEIHPDAFRGLHSLQRLSLSYNKLALDTNFTFVSALSQLPSLQKLYLTSNGLSSIPPISSSTLSKLNLDANHLTKAKFPKSFENCKRLASLVLASNQIIRLDSTDLQHLKGLPVTSIDLTRNRLSAIDPTAFQPLIASLKTLSLNRNQLTSQALESALQNFANKQAVLSVLSVEANPLHRLDRRLLANLKGLLDLSLDGNKFRSVDNAALTPVNSSLQRLSLNSCGLNDTALARLQLNKILHLTHLYAHSNQLTTFPRTLPPTLKYLDLHDNQLSEVKIPALPDLRQLSLKSNEIAHLDTNEFHNCYSLQMLDLSNNRLYRLPKDALAGLNSLEKLFLSHQQENPLSVIDATALSDAPSLEHLDLSDNSLGSLFSLVKEVSSSPFQGLRQLKRLNLARNSIRWLSPALLSQTVALQRLDLTGNQLPLVNMSQLPGTLKHLLLVDNPLRCSCQWLSAEASRRVSQLKKTVCASPSSEIGKPIDEASVHERCTRHVPPPPPPPRITPTSRAVIVTSPKMEKLEDVARVKTARAKQNKQQTSNGNNSVGSKVNKEAKKVGKKILKATLFGKISPYYLLSLIPGVALIVTIYKCYKKKGCNIRLK